uniref:Uncharacterized protein n=1 Tax=Nelumbo nucifera TaxID=4432 RepID=A0A822XDT7_NELNU|nr:TPA_asm: hypothetical protein HUJ06_019535 [Nelumbo nucifera]
MPACLLFGSSAFPLIPVLFSPKHNYTSSFRLAIRSRNRVTMFLENRLSITVLWT